MNLNDGKDKSQTGNNNKSVPDPVDYFTSDDGSSKKKKKNWSSVAHTFKIIQSSVQEYQFP